MCVHDRDECLANQIPPNLKRGDSVSSGIFLRNLKGDGVSAMYANDSDPTQFGLKVAYRHWKSSTLNGLSINIKSCVHHHCCSIHLSNNSESVFRFPAVVEIDLERFLAELDTEVVAVYQPDGTNKCHFELALLDSGTTGELALQAKLKAFTPGEKDKVPNHLDVAKRQELLARAKKYETVFLVRTCTIQQPSAAAINSTQ